MKHNTRWLIYLLIGATFGIADFFIETVARNFLKYPALLFVGFVWVIPSFLVALYEFKKSGSRKNAILASILVWVVGVISYYIFYAIKLSLDESLVSFDISEILIDLVFWGVASVIGGAVTGFLASLFPRNKTLGSTDGSKTN